MTILEPALSPGGGTRWNMQFTHSEELLFTRRARNAGSTSGNMSEVPYSNRGLWRQGTDRLARKPLIIPRLWGPLHRCQRKVHPKLGRDGHGRGVCAAGFASLAGCAMQAAIASLPLLSQPLPGRLQSRGSRSQTSTTTIPIICATSFLSRGYFQGRHVEGAPLPMSDGTRAASRSTLP